MNCLFSKSWVISHYALIYEIKTGTFMPKKYLGHAKLNFHLKCFSKKKKKYPSKMGFHHTEILATGVKLAKKKLSTKMGSHN